MHSGVGMQKKGRLRGNRTTYILAAESHSSRTGSHALLQSYGPCELCIASPSTVAAKRPRAPLPPAATGAATVVAVWNGKAFCEGQT
jgi:hypothetical protein